MHNCDGLRAIFCKNQTISQHFQSDPLQICPFLDIIDILALYETGQKDFS